MGIQPRQQLCTARQMVDSFTADYSDTSSSWKCLNGPAAGKKPVDCLGRALGKTESVGQTTARGTGPSPRRNNEHRPAGFSRSASQNGSSRCQADLVGDLFLPRFPVSPLERQAHGDILKRTNRVLR